ncbi:MAG: TusE/DsrC/DsvC family sulfur relay protein [Arenicellales bacterium]
MGQVNRPSFDNAPHNWNPELAEQMAQEQSLELSEDHWDAIKGLQEYFAKHEFGKRRELTDALDEKFHQKGGMKYLYQLFPDGPVAQGCVIAGIQPPSGSVDLSFGSVV